MKEWQFNVLFFVAVGGAILAAIGPEVGLDITKNPTALTGVGAILTYVLAQKRSLIRKPPGEIDEKDTRTKEEEDDAER